MRGRTDVPTSVKAFGVMHLYSVQTDQFTGSDDAICPKSEFLLDLSLLSSSSGGIILKLSCLFIWSLFIDTISNSDNMGQTI
jgi:hypothetical protein